MKETLKFLTDKQLLKKIMYLLYNGKSASYLLKKLKRQSESKF